MARQGKTGTRTRLARTGGAIKRTAKKVTARLRPKRRQETQAASAPRKAKKQPEEAKTARPAQRRTDIPLEVLNRTYSPKQTSLKAPFRASGQEQESDQELAGGFADERWNDEDRFTTNKSGDPRIGTHGRKYE